MHHDSENSARSLWLSAGVGATASSYQVVILAAVAYALLPIVDFGLRYIPWRLDLPLPTALFEPIVPLGAALVLVVTAATVARRAPVPWVLSTMAHSGAAAGIGGGFARLISDAGMLHAPLVPSAMPTVQPSGGMSVSLVECYMCPTASDILMVGLVAGLVAALLAVPIGCIARLLKRNSSRGG